MAVSGGMLAAQKPRPAGGRSPDLKIDLAENGNRLADSKNMM